MEFLVTMELSPDAVPSDERAALASAEARVAGELRATGTIANMWRLPGRRASVSIWNVNGPDELHEALVSLPLNPWMRVDVVALARHYVEDGLPHE